LPNKLRYKCFNVLTVLILAIPVFAGNAYPAPALHPQFAWQEPREHVHKLPDVRGMRALGINEDILATKLGTIGQKKIAAIIVNFASAGATTSGSATINAFELSTVQGYLKRMAEYYSEVSYGKLQLVISTFPANGAFNLSNTMQSYGAPDTVLEANTHRLFKDAVAVANENGANISTATYNAVMILHAGYGQESTGVEGDIWSVFLSWEGYYNSVCGFNEGLLVPAKEKESDPLGTICHEFGHQLGLADMYRTGSISKSIVGVWCLMDYGNWGGKSGDLSGSNPSHTCAWCKTVLGWVSPSNTSNNISSTQVIVSSTIGKQIVPSERALEGIIKIPIDTGNKQGIWEEYFLVEYRRKSEPKLKYDQGLCTEGLLIWHVDETVLYGKLAYPPDGGVLNTRFNHNIINNKYSTDYLGVKLHTSDRSEPGDADSGCSSKHPFCDGAMFTTPDTKSNNGQESSITIEGIFGTGNSYLVSNILRTKIGDDEILSMYGSPNPCSSGLFTASFVLGKPSSTRQILVFTINGELIKTIPSTEIRLISLSDESYKYEAQWDLTNTYGQKVAAGVYLYALKTEKSLKVGRMAVVK